MFCYSPGKAAGMFSLRWPMLPDIVAKLAGWQLRTLPDLEVCETLLFMAATKEAGGASARVEATFRDLKAWLPGPQAAGLPLFGYTDVESNLAQHVCSTLQLLQDVLWDSLEDCQTVAH